MTMHADLIAAMKAGWPLVHLVTVTLPDHTIFWTLGRGFIKWDGNTYRARDATYGTLAEISEITDGIDDDGSPVQITITPPSLASMAALAAADAQGGWVTIHLTAKNPDTGLMVGDPYPLHLGELDQPRLRPGKVRRLEYDIITGEARALQPNEEQRQTDAFHQFIWDGELGNEHATDGTKRSYWREDEPRNAIGLLTGRGSEKDNAIEFTYEPNAPLAFPFGRCAVGGTIRYRVGYGPTSRWYSVFATVGASGPVQACVAAAFDDQVTTFDGSDRALGGDHAGEMWFKFLPGDQPSAALTSPTGTNAHSSPAPGWGVNHKLSGRPCYVWTGKENSKKNEFSGGIEKPVLTLEGLFGHDPRDVGSDIEDPTTWPWLEEGCVAGLNWCFGRWEGPGGGGYGVPYACVPVGGIAAPLSTIDVAAFTAAADIADANGWKMAGVAFSDQNKIDVLEDMLRASGAIRSRRCGMISCVSFGAAVTSVLTATAADTAGALDISLAPSRLERKNTGIPSFYSEDNSWEITPIAAVSNAAWVTEDGGRNTDGFEYRYCPDKDQAAQLCYLELANGREPVSGGGPFKPWMMQLEPGAAFDWDEPEYLLVDVKVRVWKRTWSPASCTVKLEFRQETDSKYAEAMALTGVAPPPTVPPTPLDPTPSTPDTVDWDITVRPIEVSGVQQPGLDVTGAASGDNIGSVQIEVGPSGTGPWEQVYFGPDTTEAVPVNGLIGGEDYYVAVTYWSLKGVPSAKLIKGPYTAPDIVIPLTPDVLDDADVIRGPGGSGGGTFTGDLDATEGATWGVDIYSRPAELTDGRIGTALNSSGVLQTNIPTGLANSSNLLRRSGGGVFTGSLAATDDSAVVALSGTLGALATSALTEAKVQGRYLGEYAGDSAANTAGFQNGDMYIDTSLTPSGLKTKAGGTIKEVDLSGIRVVFETQKDVGSDSFNVIASQTVAVSAGSRVEAWWTGSIETTPNPTTQGSGALACAGSWKIEEVGSVVTKTLSSGNWSVTASGGTNVTSITIDSITDAPTVPSVPSTPSVVSLTESKTYRLQMRINGGDTKPLSDIGIRLYVQIQRVPVA